MKNASPLLALEDAQQQLLSAVAQHAQASERIALLDAAGRVLAEDLISEINIPAQACSAMDGYAINAAALQSLTTNKANAADAQGRVRLPVTQRIPAGSVPAPLSVNTAARIFTGALMPAGADTVVMQELCELDGDGDAVWVPQQNVSGKHVRQAGEEVAIGKTVLQRDTRLGAAELGMAASIGKSHVQVTRTLRVALLCTGDELALPGEALPPAGVYNSNRYMLRGLLQQLGCEVHDMGRVHDTLDATRAALRDAALQADLVLSTGGVSVGEEDHVKTAMQAEGELMLWKLAIKPGKPFAFGRILRGDHASGSHSWFAGLPGNPVSALVTFALLVRPLILKLQGVASPLPQAIPARAAFDWPRADSRREFLRVKLNAAGELALFPHQGSAALASCVWADGLLDNPPGQTIARGDVVRFLPFAMRCGV